MKIINQTKNTVLAEDAIIADTFLKRIKGLLGRKDFKPGGALTIKPCNSIHTFFMRFPIDGLFLDKDNCVVAAVPFISPFRLTYIYFTAVLAIELPAGTLSFSHTQKGDRIAII